MDHITASDLICPRLIRLLATTSIIFQAKISELSTLTKVIRLLAKADLSAPVLLPSTTATLVPTESRTCKIWPVAIGQALRHFTTKAIHLQSVQNTAGHNFPGYVATGIPACKDSIGRDCPMHSNGYGQRNSYVCISVNVSTVFKTYYQRKMLNLLPSRAANLARFIKTVYGQFPPPPFTIYSLQTPRHLQTWDCIHQGHLASMLLFSLTIEPLTQS